MKKKYQKPKIAFDSYVVATNVATCNTPFNLEGEVEPIDMGGWTIYQENSACMFPAENVDCYGVSLLDVSLFKS